MLFPNDQHTTYEQFLETNILYGNDIVQLIETYKNEILKIDESQRSSINETQIKTIFIAYPIALFSFVYASFKNEAQGKRMMRDFNSEFIPIFDSEKHSEGISKLVDAFRQKITNDANGISQFAIEVYKSSTFNQAESEEVTWVRNYIRAIHLIYSKYNEAAEKFGFVKPNGLGQ